MSGKILKLLGPVRRRLGDRVEEADLFLQENDIMNLRSLRPRLLAIINHLAKSIDDLNSLSGLGEDEQFKVDNEIERCSQLMMDAQEKYAEISERIDELGDQTLYRKQGDKIEDGK